MAAATARRRASACAASLAALLGARTAAAQYDALDKNDYALELFQGPLLAPNRVTGLAGATTAIADAVEGVYNNAAAPAVREPFSVKWFEWEPSVGVSLPGVFGGTDFNNRGEKGLERNRRLGRRRTIETTDDFLYVQAGVWLQLGALGLSATADSLTYDVAGPQEATPSLSLGILRTHLVAAYSLLGNQLCIGAGARIVSLNVRELDATGTGVLTMLGAAPQVGVVIKPDDVPWRFGATLRSTVSARPFSIESVIDEQRSTGETVRTAGSFVLPERVTQPWELEAGIAYQLGPRPLNPRWIDPRAQENEVRSRIDERRRERQRRDAAELASYPTRTLAELAARNELVRALAKREATERFADAAELSEVHRRLEAERRARFVNWPRERILLLASVLVAGPSSGAVALEGFINRERELVGTTPSIMPRFAVESEPIPNWVKFRAGIYLEPSRFEDGTTREHFTVGADLKTIPWDVFGIIGTQTWRLSAFADVAPRYLNFGLAVGAWH